MARQKTEYSKPFLNVTTYEFSEIEDPIAIKYPKHAKFVVAIPHAGIYVPEYCMKHLNMDTVTFPQDIDYCTDKIYDLVAAGGIVFSTQLHRYVVDLNRDRTDFSDSGVIRKIAFNGNQLIKKEYSKRKKEDLLRRFYDPFFALINMEMEDLKKKHGRAFLLNAHSMYSTIPKTRQDIENRERPGFCICTGRGKTADPEMISAFEQILRENSAHLETSVEIDYPFEDADGISAVYGKPKSGYHCILLEVNQGLYYDETNLAEKPGRVAEVHRIIAKTMNEFAEFL